ncbi:ABC transporter permease [Breznakiella homolactica]|uniref:ABC transporter permease n=1 Tax=Breznakiella homolactica TaxID=2798577 RepID=A0A7T7XJY6_9SPIR|nr:ABC transporter permease [Breznakiella homolactica]QQO07766.1 ABC transporter permease [Breznakiella homolactica]
MVYIKTIWQYMLVLFFVLALNFALPRIAPGTPATYLAGVDVQVMSEAEIQRMLHEFKLDLPVLEQFKHYILGIFRKDLGLSVIYGQPVWNILMDRLPWTILIMGAALCLSAFLGVLIGVIGAWKRGGTRDVGALVLVMFFGSVPPFWIAMLLITLFSATLNWLPSFGAYAIAAVPGTWAYTVGVLRRLILPVATLTIVKTGSMYLTTRSSMIISMEEDYILLAHAKGLKEKTVVFSHALRNAVLPIYTNVMVNLGAMVGGTAVVETVFSYPGIGNTIYESVRARDYNLLQGSFLVISVSILLCNLIADLGYPLLDPRVRRKGAAA